MPFFETVNALCVFDAPLVFQRLRRLCSSDRLNKPRPGTAAGNDTRLAIADRAKRMAVRKSAINRLDLDFFSDSGEAEEWDRSRRGLASKLRPPNCRECAGSRLVWPFRKVQDR